MKNISMIFVAAIALAFSAVGYTAGTDDESTDSSPAMGMHENMHGVGEMHLGMSPVTIVIYPGMMPMMGHGMKPKNGHKTGENRQKDSGKHHDNIEERIGKMEEQLANIEKLLGEMRALQKAE